MRTLCAALGVVTLLVVGGCASDNGKQVRESPCEWGDNRPGCEQEKVQCSDPRNCY